MLSDANKQIFYRIFQTVLRKAIEALSLNKHTNVVNNLKTDIRTSIVVCVVSNQTVSLILEQKLMTNFFFTLFALRVKSQLKIYVICFSGLKVNKTFPIRNRLTQYKFTSFLRRRKDKKSSDGFMTFS